MKEKTIKPQNFLEFFNEADYSFYPKAISWYKKLLKCIMFSVNYYANSTDKFDYNDFIDSNYPILSTSKKMKTCCFNPYTDIMITNTLNIRKMIIELVLESFADYFFQYKNFKDNYRILIYDTSFSPIELENDKIINFYNYTRPLYDERNYSSYIEKCNVSLEEVFKYLVPNYYKSRSKDIIFYSKITGLKSPFEFIFKNIKLISIETDIKGYIIINNEFYKQYESIQLENINDKDTEDIVSEIGYYCNKDFNKIFEIVNGDAIF